MFVYLLVFLFKLSGLLFEGLLVFCRGVVPHLSQLLGYVSNGQAGGLTFDLGAILRTEDEEGRSEEAGKVNQVIITLLVCAI